MKPRILAYLAALLTLCFLTACGPRSEPEALQGEGEAEAAVNGFLTALQAGDYELATAFLHHDPDRILDDLPKARELFFGIPPTGWSLLDQGREQYGMRWHIFVDLKLSYGDMMKPLRFTLAPGAPPKIRGVNPRP